MVGNDENDMLPLEDADLRFFILKVCPLPKEDPDFHDKLKDEIPAFLHYIKNRKIIHPRENRGWIGYQYLKTDQSKKIIEHSKSQLEKNLIEFVTDYMNTYDVGEFKIDLMHLKLRLDAENGYKKHDKSEIREFLTETKGLIPSKTTERYTLYIGITEDGDIKEEKLIGKPYTFKAENWMTEKQLKDFIS